MNVFVVTRSTGAYDECQHAVLVSATNLADAKKYCDEDAERWLATTTPNITIPWRVMRHSNNRGLLIEIRTADGTHGELLDDIGYEITEVPLLAEQNT